MEKLTPDALRARIHAAIGEPEITGRGFDLGAAPARRRRWRWLDLGLGTAPAPVRAGALLAVVVAVASALTVGTVLHLRSLPKPAGSLGGPVGTTTTPTASALPTPGAGPSVTAADGFLPEDVTAVSADQWWVLGFDTAGCTGAACTRILATADGGQTFTSIPTPTAAVSGLRFRDPEDGWAYSSTTVWATHDGGARWSATAFPGMVIEDLETSGEYVYAIACTSTTGTSSVCSLERSPIASDGWQALSIPADLLPAGQVQAATAEQNPSNQEDLATPMYLNVHGSDLWMAVSSGGGDNQVLRSTDNGVDLSAAPICPGAGGITSLYDVSQSVVWAVCYSSTLQEPWLSVDGGGTFSALPAGAEPTSSLAGIAATSASNAVVAGGTLQLTTDGGRTFQTLYDNGSSWSIVGFTTSADGFAFSSSGTRWVTDPLGGQAPPMTMWRTVDGGAVWYQLQFP